MFFSIISIITSKYLFCVYSDHVRMSAHCMYIEHMFKVSFFLKYALLRPQTEPLVISAIPHMKSSTANMGICLLLSGYDAPFQTHRR
jgi:hypothetical protein